MVLSKKCTSGNRAKHNEKKKDKKYEVNPLSFILFYCEYNFYF